MAALLVLDADAMGVLELADALGVGKGAELDAETAGATAELVFCTLGCEVAELVGVPDPVDEVVSLGPQAYDEIATDMAVYSTVQCDRIVLLEEPSLSIPRDYHLLDYRILCFVDIRDLEIGARSPW